MTDYLSAGNLPIGRVDTDRERPAMKPSIDLESWENGFDTAIDEAIQMVDAMRSPGIANMAAPILLRIRAELIALRERGPAVNRAA